MVEDLPAALCALLDPLPLCWVLCGRSDKHRNEGVAGGQLSEWSVNKSNKSQGLNKKKKKKQKKGSRTDRDG